MSGSEGSAGPGPARVRLSSGEEIAVRVTAPAESNGALPLVLLPGIAGAGALFASLVPRLARGRPVAAVDLPRRFLRAHPVESAVAALLETLDHLGWWRADILGQSFGALVAVRAWKTAPERTARLLLAPPAVRPAGWRGAGVLGAWLTVGSLVRFWPARRVRSLERVVRAAGGYPAEPDILGEEFESLVGRVRRVDAVALVRRLACLRTHDWVAELEGVSAPLLILVGNREVEFLPSALRRYFETRPDTVWRVVPGGHMPFLSAREEFACAVEAFLDATEPRSGTPPPEPRERSSLPRSE